MRNETSIRFTVTEDEWLRWVRETRDHKGVLAYYPWKQAVGYTALAVGIAVAGGVLYAVVPSDPVVSNPPKWLFWIALGMAGAIPLSYLIWTLTHPSIAVKRWLRRGDARAAMGEQAVTIDDQRLRWAACPGEYAFKWSAVSEMTVSKSFLCMQIGEGVILIPKRAFAPTERADEFFAMAREYRAAAPPSELRYPECQYDFTGTPVDRCPECGWNREP